MACCFSARYYKCLAWSVSQHEMHLRPLGLVTSSVFKMGLYRSKHELYDVKKQHPFYEYMQTFSIQLLSAINEVAWRTVSWQNAGQPWGHSCHLKRSQSAIHERIGLIFPLFYCFLGIYPIFCLSTVLFYFFILNKQCRKWFHWLAHRGQVIFSACLWMQVLQHWKSPDQVKKTKKPSFISMQ